VFSVFLVGVAVYSSISQVTRVEVVVIGGATIVTARFLYRELLAPDWRRTAMGLGVIVALVGAFLALKVP